jgi:hypothetical protein
MFISKCIELKVTTYLAEELMKKAPPKKAINPSWLNEIEMTILQSTFGDAPVQVHKNTSLV